MTCRGLVGVAVVTLGIGFAGARAHVSAGADETGELKRFDPDTFRVLPGLKGVVPGDEFGTTVGARFMVTAPGAPGGGQLFLLTDTGAISDTARAADLAAEPMERLGESWADLGHPPGFSSVLAVGAPGNPAAATGHRTATPSVVLVEFRGGTSAPVIGRSGLRVSGPAGSMFGWRVVGTDSQFPAGSYLGSFVVAAPLEDKGKQTRAGAVYKFDTVSGAQIWRFAGRRRDELAGYSISLLGDRNGDGSSEVLVGAPGTSDGRVAGRLYVVSGADGTLLQAVEAPEGALLFGFHLRSTSINPAAGRILVSAPATARGRKTGVGAVYRYADLDSAPRVLRGKRRDQGFGTSLAVTRTHLLVGSVEGHPKAGRDRRGSVTVFLPDGRAVRTLRGTRGGQYFGRSISPGLDLVVGAPAAPPVLMPQ